MPESTNTNPASNEGQIVAHMHGDGSSAMAEELASSSKLASDLSALEKLDSLLQQRFGGLGIPPEQDMVDVVTGQASPSQRLIVAAYVRNSTRGQYEMAELEKELAKDADAASGANSSLSQRFRLLVATPLALNLGLRSLADNQEQQTLQVTDLQAQVTLRIVPPIRERWQLEGYVTQDYAPVAEAEVLLHGDHTHQQSHQSDDDGFFLFDDLDAGQYSLYIHLTNGILLVSDLDLTEADV